MTQEIRKGLISHVLARHAQPRIDVVAKVWSPLAAEIALIAGQGGFDALFERSCMLSGMEFSGIDCPNGDAGPARRFDAKLFSGATVFEGMTEAEIIEANGVLLLAITDLLASMIGENLTVSILCTACQVDVTNLRPTLRGGDDV